MLKKTWREIMVFFAAHKWELLQLGAMAAIVVLPAIIGDTCLASTAGSGKMSVLTKPIETVKEFVTGPLAGGVTVLGAVGGAANYMNNTQQSVSPKFIGITGAGLAMTQAEEILGVFGVNVSGCIF